MINSVSKFAISISLASGLISSYRANAQEYTDYLPPTPTVAALGKYVDAPVSLYTGTPDISIPIYEIKAGNFRLPITLSYHAGGFRVEEEASWVGLGWSLNAGGVITRSIRHLQDDLSTRDAFFDTYDGHVLDVTNAADYQNLYRFAEATALDGLPDLYIYNFNGYAGKFIYLDNDVKLIPKNPILVSNNGINSTGWTIKDDKGNTYLFTTVESAKTRGRTTATLSDISYYLSKIVTSTNEEITFQYKDTEFFQSVDVSQSNLYKESLLNWQFVSGSSDAFVTTLYGKELEKIIFPNGEVEFVSDYAREDINKAQGTAGALKLTDIKIKDNAGVVKRTFHLEQDYFTSSPGSTDPMAKRLKLISLAEEAQPVPGELPPTKMHTFEYNTGVTLPRKDSKAQDHWGYYNANTLNTLVPPFVDDGDSDTDLEPIRDTDTTRVKACLLTRVTYPTGGSTDYVYEANDYGYVRDSAIPSTIQKVNAHTYYEQANAYNNITEPHVSDTAYFDVAINQQVRIEVDIVYPDVYFEGSHSQAKIELYGVDSDADPGLLLETFTRTENGNNYKELAPGRYRLLAIATMDGSTSTATAAYQTFDEITVFKKYAGGVRLRKIVQSDGINPDIVTTYTYIQDGNANKSSGVLTTEPNYFRYSHSFEDACHDEDPGSCVCFYNEIDMLTITSESVRGLGSGSHIGYKEVQVHYGANDENGKTDYTFTTYSNLSPGTESDVSWRRGKLKTRTDYNSDGRKVRFLENFYSFLSEDHYYGLLVQSAGKHPCAQASGFSLGYPYYFDQTESVLSSEFFALTRQYVEEYGNSEEDTLSKEEIYFYDNLSHLQPTRVVRESDNKRITEYSSFPLDYSEVTGPIGDLKQAHVVSAPIEKVVWQEDLDGSDTKILSGELLVYAPGGKGLVQEFRQLETASPIDLSGFKFSNRPEGIMPYTGTAQSFDADDSYQLRVSYRYGPYYRPIEIAENGDTTALVWGYSHQLVTAVASNSSFDKIAYTGFENNDEGNWDGYTANSDDAYTGLKAYTGALSKSGVPPGDYVITLWTKAGTGLPSISGASAVAGETVNGWQLYTWQTYLSGTLTINSNGGIIDDVRLYPVVSQMQTFIHDPLKGVTSASDANNIVTRYEYYPTGQLRRIRDHNKDITVQYTYQYFLMPQD